MDKIGGRKVDARNGGFRKARAAAALGLICMALAGMAWPALAVKKSLAMLDQLEHGEWELRALGGGSSKMCMTSGRELIQLRHPGDACNTVVVDDKPNEVTVQYTCPGHGYGRTHIRRETDALIQIDSQGIAKGQPFAFATEGRRIGACGG